MITTTRRPANLVPKKNQLSNSAQMKGSNSLLAWNRQDRGDLEAVFRPQAIPR
jgi:hypothetical protein